MLTECFKDHYLKQYTQQWGKTVYSIITAISLNFPHGNIDLVIFKVKTVYKIQKFQGT